MAQIDMNEIYEKLAPDEKLIMWPVDIPITVFLHIDPVENATELFFLNSNEAVLKFACDRMFEDCMSIIKDCQAKYHGDEFSEFEVGLEQQVHKIKLHEIKSNDLDKEKNLYDCYKEIEKDEKQLTSIYSAHKDLDELTDILDQLREARIDVFLQKNQPFLQTQFESHYELVKNTTPFRLPRRPYQSSLINRKFIIKYVQNVTYIVKQYKLFDLKELVKEAEEKSKMNNEKRETIDPLLQDFNPPVLSTTPADFQSDMLLYKLATMTIRDHREFVKQFSKEVKTLVTKIIYIDKEINEMKHLIFGEKYEVKKSAPKDYISQQKVAEQERKTTRMARMEEKFRKKSRS